VASLRVCSKCKVEQELTEFQKNSKVKLDGRGSVCKSCRKLHYINNKEIIRKAAFDRYWDDPEAARAAARASHSKRKGTTNAKRKEEYAADPVTVLERNKKYREANPEKVKMIVSKYANSPVSGKAVDRAVIRLTVEESPEVVDGVLTVECAYCKTRFSPKYNLVNARIASLEGRNKGENRLYCSDACKQACPIFSKHSDRCIPGDDHRSRPLQPELRQMALDLYGHECARCGDTEKSLIAHHIDPVKCNPIESADLDNMVILCEDCHELSHKLPGCNYAELAAVKINCGDSSCG
jgi:5-methylcytosine-specific restriction endonuclease McrA